MPLIFHCCLQSPIWCQGQISARHHHSPAPFGVGLMSLDIARVGHRTAGSTAGSCIDPVFNNMKHIETPFYVIMLFYVIFPSSETHLPEVSKSFLVAKLPGVYRWLLSSQIRRISLWTTCHGMSERIDCGSSQYVVNPTIMDDIW